MFSPTSTSSNGKSRHRYRTFSPVRFDNEEVLCSYDDDRQLKRSKFAPLSSGSSLPSSTSSHPESSGTNAAENDYHGPSNVSQRNMTEKLSPDELHHRKTRCCPYCNYQSFVKSNLDKHIKTHSGERPYACPYCPFRAIQRTNLNSHIRRHTGERPFACSFCPYNATRNSTLKEHILSKHSEHYQSNTNETD